MWKHFSARVMILVSILLLNAFFVVMAVAVSPAWAWGGLVGVPLLTVCVHDLRQRRHTILHNYPIVSHLRYLLEAIRPEMHQYFFESDLSGAPFNRRQRSIVYQRAKNEMQTSGRTFFTTAASKGYPAQ